MGASAETRRFGVVIGNNHGRASERPLRYAERDARKVHRLLTELGGFRPTDLALIEGATAKEAWAVIRRMQRRLNHVAKSGASKTLFLLYYSGHADGDVLELGDSSIRFEDLKRFVEGSGAGVRIAFIDSCHSGNLVGMKGGNRGPAYAIDVGESFASSGYAIITSSAGSELSQESAQVRGAYFTHYLVSALRGAGDASRDGRVTLTEAYRYAYLRTVARTSTAVGGAQHPMYDYKLAGRGDIVLTVTDRSRSQLRVSGLKSGRVIVLDDRGDVMVGEVVPRADRPSYMALLPGVYRVYHVEKGRARRASVRIRRARDTTLVARDFEPVTLARAEARGGLFRPAQVLHLSAVGALRQFPLSDGALSYGGVVQLGWEPTPGWRPSIRLTATAAPDAGDSIGYYDLGGSLGIAWVRALGPISLYVDAQAGYEHLFQEQGHTSGFAYAGLLGFDIPAGASFFRVGGGAGGRVFQMRDRGLTHRLDWVATLGLGWRWDL